MELIVTKDDHHGNAVKNVDGDVLVGSKDFIVTKDDHHGNAVNNVDGDVLVGSKDFIATKDDHHGNAVLTGSVDFAENKDGRWDISIQAVQCPVGDNKLQYAFQGSNPWYLKLQVSNYRSESLLLSYTFWPLDFRLFACLLVSLIVILCVCV